MKKKCDKAIRRAYRKGRKQGFDKGFNLAQTIYAAMVADLIRTIEELNTEIIMNEEDNQDET